MGVLCALVFGQNFETALCGSWDTSEDQTERYTFLISGSLAVLASLVDSIIAGTSRLHKGSGDKLIEA